MPRTEEALDAILRTLVEEGEISPPRQSSDPGEGRSVQIDLPPLPASAATTVHQVKVSLRAARPSVWRRLEIPSDLPLNLVHEVLQTAFGWFDCHPHQFETACGDFGDPAQDGVWSRRADEGAAALGQVMPTAQDTMGYVYDFGANWRHHIDVEAIVPAAPGVRYPRCIALRGTPPAEAGKTGPEMTADELTRQLAGLAGVVVPAS
jgi:hypothetical protein